MDEILETVYSNQIILLLAYASIFVVVSLIIYYLYKKINGNFKETNVFKILKKIYKKYDYPYIKEIILPFNKENYAYYDAIVLGNKFVYILEIKSHNEVLQIDPVNNWHFKQKNKNITFLNPFYELDVKKQILNRYLDINVHQIIEVVIINNHTKINGNKGNHHLIRPKQINSLINHYESKKDIYDIPPNVIEQKGNYVLDINIKNRKIRKEVIENIKNERSKR